FVFGPLHRLGEKRILPMQIRVACRALILISLFAIGSARGQSPLQWKLKPGDSLAVTITQETDSEVSFSGKKATTNIQLTLVVGWNTPHVPNTRFIFRHSTH